MCMRESKYTWYLIVTMANLDRFKKKKIFANSFSGKFFCLPVRQDFRLAANAAVFLVRFRGGLDEMLFTATQRTDGSLPEVVSVERRVRLTAEADVTSEWVSRKSLFARFHLTGQLTNHRSGQWPIGMAITGTVNRHQQQFESRGESRDNDSDNNNNNNTSIC